MLTPLPPTHNGADTQNAFTPSPYDVASKAVLPVAGFTDWDQLEVRFPPSVWQDGKGGGGGGGGPSLEMVFNEVVRALTTALADGQLDDEGETGGQVDANMLWGRKPKLSLMRARLAPADRRGDNCDLYAGTEDAHLLEVPLWSVFELKCGRLLPSTCDDLCIDMRLEGRGGGHVHLPPVRVVRCRTASEASEVGSRRWRRGVSGLLESDRGARGREREPQVAPNGVVVHLFVQGAYGGAGQDDGD
jgi:hypothetical protein